MRRLSPIVALTALTIALPTLCFPTAALAAPVAMDELVAKALAQSPNVQAAQSSLAAQEARIGVARSGFWPQVALSTGTSQTTSASPSQTTATPFNLTNAGVSVQQNLFTFGKLDAAVEQAQAATEAARAQAALTAVEVAYGTRAAYLGWVQAAGLEAQAAEQIRYAEATLAEANARFKAGVAPRLEVTRAQTALAQAKAAMAGARATTAQARRTLAAAIGQTAPVDGTPVFPAEPAVAKRPLGDIEAAALEHPTLHTGQAQLAQAAATRRAAEVAGMPDVSANASYGVRARDFQGAQNWAAGVNLSWPLFTGFSVTNQAEAARQSEATSRANLDARRLEILRDVDNAYLALAGAKERVPAAKSAVDSARENLVQAQGRYRAGVGSIIEVADAQQLLASAQADWVRATTSYHLAIADLQRAMGVTGVTAHDR